MSKRMKSQKKMPFAQLIENQRCARPAAAPRHPTTPFAARLGRRGATPGGAVLREVCLPLAERPSCLSGPIEVSK